jgi:hypothetical protein
MIDDHRQEKISKKAFGQLVFSDWYEIRVPSLNRRLLVKPLELAGSDGVRDSDVDNLLNVS